MPGEGGGHSKDNWLAEVNFNQPIILIFSAMA